MSQSVDKIPLLRDPAKHLRRENRAGYTNKPCWALYYGDNFIRYLSEFESDFVDSALATQKSLF